MYFHLASHIYMARFNNELIALNLITDEYVFFSEKISSVLLTAISNAFTIIDQKYQINSDEKMPQNFDKIIQFLRRKKFISKKDFDTPSKHKIQENISATGAANIDWRIKFGELDKKVPLSLFFEAYITLIKVYLILKFKGPNGLIQLIKKKKGNFFPPKKLSVFNTLTTALNQASFFYPIRVKCLEWSAALTLMALKRKWQCNLEIGLHNLPFSAHAWVKSGKKVIADSNDLPQKLFVILSEPFECAS